MQKESSFSFEKIPYLSLILFFVVLASRLPFLAEGFGTDPDSWRIALSALKFHQYNVYEVSRFPGNPVVEIANSWLLNSTPIFNNLATAILSAISVVLFFRVLVHFKIRQAFLAALTLAFVPIFYLSSVTTMDHVWAFCFFMAAFLSVLQSQILVAGILLGAAIGCRITYGAMLIPFGLWIYWHHPLSRRALSVLITTTLLSGVAFFSPVLLKYGFNFFTYYSGKTPLYILGYKLTVGVWGIWGLLLFPISMHQFYIANKTNLNEPSQKRLFTFLSTAIALYLLAFLKLPEDSAYLIPTLPFLLIFCFQFFSLRAAIFSLCLMFTSSFFMHVYKDGFHLRGPILYDFKMRKDNGKYLSSLMKSPLIQNEKNLIVAGYWLPFIDYLSTSQKNLKSTFVYELNSEQLTHWQKQGRQLFFLKDQNNNNIRINGLDLSQHGIQEANLSEN